MMVGKPLHATEQTFEAEVLAAGGPVLVDFWAAWCGPCRMLEPIVEELAQEYDGALKVVKVDVDANEALAMRYEVMSIPTLGLFRDGELVGRLVGYAPKADLKRQIESSGVLAKDRPAIAQPSA